MCELCRRLVEYGMVGGRRDPRDRLLASCNCDGTRVLTMIVKTPGVAGLGPAGRVKFIVYVKRSNEFTYLSALFADDAGLAACKVL